MDFRYRKNWLAGEFVNDIGLKVKDIIKESRDVLLPTKLICFNYFDCSCLVYVKFEKNQNE